MPRKPRAESKDLEFAVSNNADGTWSHAAIQCVVLMDIRDELKRLNALLYCHNFVGIPTTLKSIQRAMPARRKAKKP